MLNGRRERVKLRMLLLLVGVIRESREARGSWGACAALLNCYKRFRDRLIGRTSAFGAEYRGSSPRPGTKLFFTESPPLKTPRGTLRITFRGSSIRERQSK